MPRIKIWTYEEERWDIFEIHEANHGYDCKLTEKFIDRFNRLVEILEAMQCYLNIKRMKKEEKEEMEDI